MGPVASMSLEPQVPFFVFSNKMVMVFERIRIEEYATRKGQFPYPGKRAYSEWGIRDLTRNSGKLVKKIIVAAIFAFAVAFVPAQAFAESASHGQNNVRVMQHIEAKEAGCYEDGHKEYWICLDCGGCFYDEGHEKPVPNIESLKIPAHHDLTLHPETPATCTEEGNIAYWECAKCGACFSDGEGKNKIDNGSWVIPATGHSWGDVSYTWSADNSSVTATHKCVNKCEETETVNTTREVTTPATCTEAGLVTYTATFANSAFAAGFKPKEVKIEAHGHDLIWHPAHLATSEMAGNWAYWSCSRCGKYFSGVFRWLEIPEGSWVIPAQHGSYTMASSTVDTVWTPSSSEELTFRFKRADDDETTFERFIGIEVDGKAVPEKDESGKVNWTARKGSLILSLTSSFLESLAGGDHIVKAIFNDGAMEASFKLTANAPSKTTSEPALVPAQSSAPASAVTPAPAPSSDVNVPQVARVADDFSTAPNEVIADDATPLAAQPVVGDIAAPGVEVVFGDGLPFTSIFMDLDVFVMALGLCLVLAVAAIRGRFGHARSDKRSGK